MGTRSSWAWGARMVLVEVVWRTRISAALVVFLVVVFLVVVVLVAVVVVAVGAVAAWPACRPRRHQVVAVASILMQRRRWRRQAVPLLFVLLEFGRDVI